MSAIVLFSGIYCRKNDVVNHLTDLTGFTRITDEILVSLAAESSGLDEKRLSKAFSASTSLFNRYTRQKELAVAILRNQVARKLKTGNIIFDGMAGMLIPGAISHVLRVCLINSVASRVAYAVETLGIKERQAAKAVMSGDDDCRQWLRLLTHKTDPWDPTLYDMVFSMDGTLPGKAAAAIAETLFKDILKPTVSSEQAVDDFILASTVELELCRQGHHTRISSQQGNLVITINEKARNLERLKEELKASAEKIEGVASVSTEIGRGFHEAVMYRQFDFSLPSGVVLLDAEREFANTLSERLKLEPEDTALVHDGTRDLDGLWQEKPGVLIIDLNLSGPEGISILEQAKQESPETRVIVLSDTDTDTNRCLERGAWACLTKPVDIETLRNLMKNL